jgi:signal transduction histidine kinase/CheY-like chemotaxis protein
MMAAVDCFWCNMSGPRERELLQTGNESLSARHQFEQNLLLEVSQAVASTLELDAVLQIIADGTARLIGVETSAVYLVEGPRLYLGATTPPLDPGMPEGVRWISSDTHPHIARAIESRQPLVLKDAPAADLSPPERMLVELRQLRSLLFLPFCHEGEPIGVLILGTTSRARVFEERDVDLCRTLTNQLAMGVQNARLHTGLKKYSAELETQMAEQAKLSEQLRQAQKMEAVGQLAGGVAHDFNNLLQLIVGYTDMARRGIDPSSDSHKALGFVTQAADRASILVRQLLAFGRREQLRMTAVDVNQVVDGLLPMLYPVLGESISVEYRKGAELRLVWADANQLEQILVNLAINARDAMPHGGSLTITARNVLADEALRQRRSLPSTGPYVLIEVSDTGVGMDPQTRERAFEPFFTTKERGEGTGLGLSTVYGLIGQHRGAIYIVSALGRGTSIEVYLPVALGADVDETTGPASDTLRGTETILLAEDHETVRELTRAMLESAGYSVLVASNGAEAVRIIADHAGEVALALLDVVMPKQGGEKVFQYLREHQPDVPVLFATGYGANATAVVQRHEGVALIQKPYAREELLRQIRQILDSRPEPS